LKQAMKNYSLDESDALARLKTPKFVKKIRSLARQQARKRDSLCRNICRASWRAPYDALPERIRKIFI